MCLSLTVATAAEATEAFLDDAIHELGFESAHKVELAAGNIISVGLPNLERQSNELMVGAAMMLVRRPLAAVSGALLGDDAFRVNARILDFRALGDGDATGEDIEEAFRNVGYDEVEAEEADKLLDVEPGRQFNMSEGEIEKFRSLEESDGRVHEKVSGALASMLKQRFLDYVEGGLAAVDPYAREGGRSASPHHELATAFSSLKLLEKHFPTFHRSLLSFPRQSSTDIAHGFYWAKRLVDQRPAFVLSHRMAERKDDYTVAMELQYYAQHSYNSMLTLVACVPFQEGTLVLSAIRVYTDQVVGFASGMKKNVGRKRVSQAIAGFFREMRRELESQ